MPTAASATRCASCSPTPATSIPRRMRCRRADVRDRPLALARAAQFQAEVLAHYEVYEFHPVVAKLQVFCSEDLGAFYLDVLKDRLYTTAPKSLARRSAQTALWQITQAMLRWMAPFLSFTAEEAWKVFAPGARLRSSPRPTGSSTRPTRRCSPSGRASARSAMWRTRRSRRCARQAGRFLAAGQPHHHRAGADHALLAALGEDLRFVTITSAVRLALGAMRSPWRSRPRARSSASAAGTGATTSATTPSTRRSAAAAPDNLFGAGEARSVA